MIFPMPELPTISKDEIEDALRRSGYLIEYRIEDILREQGFHVAANATYPDPITSKPRELDISATGADRIGSDRDWLFSILLIECVNNPYPMAFFTKEAQADFVHVYDIFISGLPSYIGNRNIATSRLSAYLHLEKVHHYCKGRVATQFCSFTPKKSARSIEWMASHEDSHFDSFRKLCAAVNYDVEDHYSGTNPVLHDRINLQLYYPIVVVGGQLLDIRHDNKAAVTIEEVECVHYIQSSLTGGKQTDYHIDVVTEKFFPTMLSMVNKETKAIARRAKKKKDVLYSAVDRMAKAAKRNPDAMQEIITDHNNASAVVDRCTAIFP